MKVTRHDGKTNIKVENVEGDLTVESGERGPVLTFETEGVRVSFALTTVSAIQIVEALQGVLYTKQE